MTFNSIMLSQLGRRPKKLDEEIIDILQKSEAPLNVQQIFIKSSAAITSRDISLKLVQLKEKGLVQIAEYKREGVMKAQWRAINPEHSV